jgi:hypothetical protein
MKILLLVILTLFERALTLGLQLADHRRLTVAQRASAWNGATWGMAIYWFGFLSMLPWAWVTRQDWRAWRRRGLAVALLRSAWVLLLGAAAAAAILALELLLGNKVATALGVTLE